MNVNVKGLFERGAKYLETFSMAKEKLFYLVLPP